MKHYTDFKSIKFDLERLGLERDIAWEELKLTRHEFSDQISAPNWLSSLGKGFAKYGVYMILKRLFKSNK